MPGELSSIVAEYDFYQPFYDLLPYTLFKADIEINSALAVDHIRPSRYIVVRFVGKEARWADVIKTHYFQRSTDCVPTTHDKVYLFIVGLSPFPDMKFMVSKPDESVVRRQMYDQVQMRLPILSDDE